MHFRFACLVRTLLDGRVFIEPLERPELSVIGPNEDAAFEELLLGLEDRICRTHPAELPRLVRYREVVKQELLLSLLPAAETAKLSTKSTFVRRLEIPLTVVRGSVHGQHEEALVVDAGLRFWTPKGSHSDELSSLLLDHLRYKSPEEILALDHHGEERIEVLEIEAEPPHPALLTFRELHSTQRLLDPDRPRESPEAKKTASKEPRTVDTSTLDEAAVALHELAEDGELPKAFGRDSLVEELLSRLYPEREKRTPEFREGLAPAAVVLVGRSGSGKTALIHELVRRLVEVDRQKERLKLVIKDNEDADRKRTMVDVARQRRHRAYMIDGSRFIAGEGDFGGWEQRTGDVLREANESGALLHLGHVIELLDSGKSAHSNRNVAQLLGPALLRNEVHAIGEATVEAWARIESRSESFARAFRVVRVDEMDDAAVERVLLTLQAEDSRQKSKLAPKAIRMLVALTKRFRPYAALLGQCVSFHRRLVQKDAQEKEDEQKARPALDSSSIVAAFARESGIPERLLRDDVALEPAFVTQFLSARVMAQPDAVGTAASAVSVMKAGLSNPDRPIAVLFFAGPTGVGKTQLSRALAELVFGLEERLLRIDMGELSGPDALLRLMGGPHGEGILTRSVRQQPFQIILLDELEKAHEAVFDTLLGVLGEGRLTDSEGRVADFRSSIIVMTSNLGADTLRERVGFGTAARPKEEVRRHYIAEVERFFRPELFNRIDEVVVFEGLGERAVRSLVERELGLVSQREGLRQAQIELEVSAEARDLLAARGTEPRYGARPLKRTLEKELVAPLARQLVEFKGAPHGLLARCELSSQGELAIRLLQQDALGAAHVRDLNRASEQSSVLRQSLQRVGCGTFVTKLKKAQRDFAISSKHPAFWHNRQRAEKLSTRHGRAETALAGLTSVYEETEALEEFALECHYTRDAEAVVSVDGELERLKKERARVFRQLFSVTSEVRDSVTLYLQSAETSELRRWLRGVYLRLAEDMGLDVEFFFAKEVRVESDGQNDEVERSAERKRTAKRIEWKWDSFSLEHLGALDQDVVAEALVLRGSDLLPVFELEAGRHTSTDGSMTQEVSVLVEARAATVQTMSDAQTVRASRSRPLIRKIHIPRERVEDVRVDHHFTYRKNRFALEKVHDVLLAQLLVGASEEAEWS